VIKARKNFFNAVFWTKGEITASSHKNSSGDEIANVNFFYETWYM